MAVLIIGSTGFIGRELCACLRREGFEALGCGRTPRAELKNAEAGEYWSLSDGEVPGTVWERTDAVVLLAAKRPYAGFCMEDYRSNVELAARYLDLAAAHGVRRFVFASSKAVYSGPDMPWKESGACVPSSLYGASKLAAEQLGQYYCLQGKTDFISLRLAQVIGTGERKGYLINTLIDNAREKKQQTVFGTGAQRRQYVYLKDVCRAVLAALKHPQVKGVFNIGMPGGVSNLELAEAVNDAFGNTGNLRLDPSRPMAGTNDGMDVEKAAAGLAFRTQWNIRETFEDIRESLEHEHDYQTAEK